MTSRSATRVCIDAPGGPERMRLEQVELPAPGPGEVRIEHEAIGVNFIDVYHRSGLYPLPAMPSGLGVEAVGRIAEIGAGVEGWSVGDRVGYAGGVPGAYASARTLPAAQLVGVPGEIDAPSAAAVLLKGMTVEYLVRRCVRVERGMTVLWHAAAGGVGLLAMQWLREIGVTVIGTVGNEAKAALAREHGCTHPIVVRGGDFVARVHELTGGRLCDVVYDSVGRDTLAGSLACVRPRGTLVSFGNASGPPPPIDPLELGRRGSLYLTRPSLFDYTGDPQERRQSAAAVFERVARGVLRPVVGMRLPLQQAAEAHRALESRATTGAIVLVP
ncbi:MAG: quinone oxidoreductase [Myxococcota bacterium]|nr:quinone oxidoreductase [Myxococcota bacterium]MDW8363760.1 quinone oxidoreductase [Myxococcales bacterium]